MGLMGMSKIRIAQFAVLASIAAATVFFMLYSHRPLPVRTGSVAPDFNLPKLDGRNVSLRDFRGRVVVLNFWATWCPPCVEEMPSLISFAEQMDPQGITVLGASVDYDGEALSKFIARNGIRFPIVRDKDQRIASRYGTFKYPETYIIDREGRISEKLIGPMNWQDPGIVSRVRSLATAGR